MGMDMGSCTFTESALPSNFQHAIKRDLGPVFDPLAHLDLVHDTAVDQVLQHPAQVLWTNTEHGCAQAAGVVERNNLFAFGRKVLGQPVYEMNLSADGEC